MHYFVLLRGKGLRAFVFLRILACMTETRTDDGSLALTVMRRREELGLTQAELAVKAAIAHRTVQNIEYGKKPIAAVVAAIARALDLDGAELQRIADATAQAAS